MFSPLLLLKLFVFGMRDVKIFFFFLETVCSIFLKQRGPCSLSYTVNFCRVRKGFLKAEMVATKTSVYPLGLRVLRPVS